MADIIDIDRLRATPLETDPYKHILITDFIYADKKEAVLKEFPDIEATGVHTYDYENHKNAGPLFKKMMQEMESDEVRTAFEEKFTIDLTDKPFLATLRGQVQLKDGRIHTDSKSKVITILLYMNEEWPHKGGRLRVLRNGTDLEDYKSEVIPLGGTLLAFQRSDNSWHGHTKHEGVRKSIQMNWVQGEAYLKGQRLRHHASAALKKVKNIFTS